MKEYIEKGAYIDAMHGDYRDVELVKNFPTADVEEVVRCRDCKWYGHVGCAIQIVDDSDRPKDDDFCSFGERKGGDE